VQLKTGGITHPRLNIDGKPIANKYCKGKMKRTLKRESKELEAVEMDAVIIQSHGVTWGFMLLMVSIFFVTALKAGLNYIKQTAL